MNVRVVHVRHEPCFTMNGRLTCCFAFCQILMNAQQTTVDATLWRLAPIFREVFLAHATLDIPEMVSTVLVINVLGFVPTFLRRLKRKRPQ